MGILSLAVSIELITKYYFRAKLMDLKLVNFTNEVDEKSLMNEI